MSGAVDNLEWAQQILAACAASGVREFCAGAGSRNGALLAALSASQGLRVYPFFDERSAAFFALGRARDSGRPVAVLTTSGTAAAELLPALIEAHYSGVPLLALTADRPRRYRGSAAPQSIEQVNLYGVYAPCAWDCDAQVSGAEIAARLRQWREGPHRYKPAHLNLCFDEPVLSRAPQPHDYGPALLQHKDPPPDTRTVDERAEHIAKFLSSVRRPVVVVGGLHPRDAAGVREFLLRLRAPVYLEGPSQLRNDPQLAPLALRSNERVIAYGAFDSVLRLGGVPTLRFWRDLDEKFAALPVLSVDPNGFSGLPRAPCVVAPRMDALLERVELRPGDENFAALYEVDRARHEARLEICARFPRAEPALLHRLSRQLAPRTRVYLGNSLPVREWDAAADYVDRGWELWASRGANGIDGQFSTFLGLCAQDRPNAAFLGDITTLYDLNAPWVLSQIEEIEFTLYVINNGGGQIFGRLPAVRNHIDVAARDRAWILRHNLSFRTWAEMWNMGFEEWDRIPPHAPAAKQGVVELKPDDAMTASYWENFEKIWARAESS